MSLVEGAAAVGRESTMAQALDAVRASDNASKKVLKVVTNPDGTLGVEPVFHRDIQWTWREKLLWFFGRDSYSLRRVADIVHNNLPKETTTLRRDFLCTLLNQRIDRYNARCWPGFSIERLHMMTAMKRTDQEAAAIVVRARPAVERATPLQTELTSLFELHLSRLVKEAAAPGADRARLRQSFGELREVVRRELPQDEYMLGALMAMEHSFADEASRVTASHYVVDEQGILNVPKDGNCLYHAIRAVTRKSVAQLRQDTSAYLSLNYSSDGVLYGELLAAVKDDNFKLAELAKEELKNMFAELDGLLREAKDKALREENPFQELLESHLAKFRELRGHVNDVQNAMPPEEMLNELHRMKMHMMKELFLFRLNALLAGALDQAHRETLVGIKADLQFTEGSGKLTLESLQQLIGRFDELEIDEEFDVFENVKEIIVKYNDFQAGFLMRQREIKEKHIDLTNQSVAVERYIQRVREDGFWGGIPEIIAMARLYNLDIQIFMPKQDSDEFQLHTEAMQQLAPALKGIEGIPVHLVLDKKHWNLKLVEA